MRLLWICVLLSCCALLAFAWDSEDFEIFDLVTALEKAEGKGTDFYTFLNITPAATTTEISRAYRKRSLELHPDKNAGIVGIHERFARLGTIANILRDAEQRKRYDHWYKVGVPIWRGTGYYYSRYRPGLGLVLSGIALFTCALQYVLQNVARLGQVAKVNELRTKAQTAAYGPNFDPKRDTTKKRVKVALTSRSGEDGSRQKNRPTITCSVEGDRVHIVEDDGREYPLDSTSVPVAAFTRTWVFAIVRFAVGRVLGSRDSTPAPQDGDAPVTPAPAAQRTTSKPIAGVRQRKGKR